MLNSLLFTREPSPELSRCTHQAAITAALLLLLAGCAPAPSAAPAPEPAKRVRIVHTNDFHGHLLPQEPGWAEGRSVGGAAILAAHFDSAAARFRGPTFIVDGGDVMQGTAISNLSWGRATVDAFNAAGYDAAAVGNHEFDWGMDTLGARVRDSRFAWLAANIYRAGTREQPEWVRPWTMIEKDGVRVAVIGAALSTTPNIVLAGRIQGLDFGPEAPAIDRAAREARAAGADFVVVTMHVGAQCEEGQFEPAEASRGCEGEMLEVARALTEPIDLLIGGHTHRRVLAVADGLPVQEAFRYGTAYGIADLERSGSRTRIIHREIRTPFADEVHPDTAVARVVASWDEMVRPIRERVITTLAEPMPRPEANRGEYALGNLLVDAYKTATGAHVSVINNGSIRRGLPGGTITYGTLFELQPFQNELVTVGITGDVLRAALEHALDGDGEPDAQISGMNVRYDPTAPVGSRIREIRLWDGREVAPETPITLGTTEFVATGGDGYGMLDGGTLARTGLVDLDALVRYLQSLPPPIDEPQKGRWVAEGRKD